MGIVKDHRFWVGVVVGYLLIVFVPKLNFRNRMAGGQ